jgi:hypothetical protein
MNTLLIKEASFDNHKYTPIQWQQKLEQQNVSKKQEGSKLHCPDGCLLKFTKAYQYYKGQKEIHVQAHFSHICQERESKCLYIKKYGKHNGESEEHLEAKRMISTKDVTFRRICKHPSCDNSVTVSPDMSWTAKTEVRLKNKWLADVVYYGPDDEIKCVIEIKHTHGVDGEKRKWLLNQSFEYIEVSTNKDIEKREYRIIDMKGNYYCMGGTEDFTCHTEKKELDTYFVKYMLRQDLTKGFWYLYQQWHPLDCKDYNLSLSWDDHYIYDYSFYLREKDESLAEKFNSFPQLVQAMKIHEDMKAAREEMEREEKEEEERRKEKERLRLEKVALAFALSEKERKESEAQKEEEEKRKERERLRLKRKREQEYEERRKETLKKREEERKRQELSIKWRNLWKTTDINKYLLKKEPHLVHNHGLIQGCHVLLLAYIHPYEINWILGKYRNTIWDFWMHDRNNYKIIGHCCRWKQSRHYLTERHDIFSSQSYQMERPYDITIGEWQMKGWSMEEIESHMTEWVEKNGID